MPLSKLVSLLANFAHIPLLLLHHVAFNVSPSESLQITYMYGSKLIPELSLVGDSPLCVGGLLVVLLALAFSSDHW